MIGQTTRTRTPLLLLGICAAGALYAACSDDEPTVTTTASSSSSSSGAGGATGSGGSPGGSGGTGAMGGETSSSQGGTGGAGGAGGEGGGGHMGIDAACGGCFEMQEACNDAGDACEDDAQCGPWLGCVEECADTDWSSACIDDCDAAFPNAGPLKTTLTTCFCAACANLCAPFCG